MDWQKIFCFRMKFFLILLPVLAFCSATNNIENNELSSQVGKSRLEGSDSNLNVASTDSDKVVIDVMANNEEVPNYQKGKRLHNADFVNELVAHRRKISRIIEYTSLISLVLSIAMLNYYRWSCTFLPDVEAIGQAFRYYDSPPMVSDTSINFQLRKLLSKSGPNQVNGASKDKRNVRFCTAVKGVLQYDNLDRWIKLVLSLLISIRISFSCKNEFVAGILILVLNLWVGKYL